ncbi:MAG: hypothetical protein WCT08_05275 [Patescibacteria group bacterium]|jgi:hypothetical protein
MSGTETLSLLDRVRPTIPLPARLCKCKTHGKEIPYEIFGRCGHISQEMDSIHVIKEPLPGMYSDTFVLDINGPAQPVQVIIVQCNTCFKQTFHLYSDVASRWRSFGPQGWRKKVAFKWDYNMPADKITLQNVRVIQYNGFNRKACISTVLNHDQTSFIFPRYRDLSDSPWVSLWSAYFSSSRGDFIETLDWLVDNACKDSNWYRQRIATREAFLHQVIEEATRRIAELKGQIRSPRIKAIGDMLLAATRLQNPLASADDFRDKYFTPQT